MPPTVAVAIAQSLTGRRLLDHPYYRSWQDGLLATPDIGAYAEQYRHFESALPEVLARVADGLEEGAARRLVEDNRDDELSNPRPHLELFDSFAAAVGAASERDPTPATRELVGVYHASVSAGPVPALAVIAAYETQAADIAATKAGALRRHHGLTQEQTEFWNVHADIEPEHAAWTLEALAMLAAAPAVVAEWASLSASRWWGFLDEREATRSQ